VPHGLSYRSCMALKEQVEAVGDRYASNGLGGNHGQALCGDTAYRLTKPCPNKEQNWCVRQVEGERKSSESRTVEWDWLGVLDAEEHGDQGGAYEVVAGKVIQLQAARRKQSAHEYRKQSGYRDSVSNRQEHHRTSKPDWKARKRVVGIHGVVKREGRYSGDQEGSANRAPEHQRQRQHEVVPNLIVDAPVRAVAAHGGEESLVQECGVLEKSERIRAAFTGAAVVRAEDQDRRPSNEHGKEQRRDGDHPNSRQPVDGVLHKWWAFSNVLAGDENATNHKENDHGLMSKASQEVEGFGERVALKVWTVGANGVQASVVDDHEQRGDPANVVKRPAQAFGQMHCGQVMCLMSTNRATAIIDIAAVIHQPMCMLYPLGAKHTRAVAQMNNGSDSLNQIFTMRDGLCAGSVGC